jgi:hypothetical protein
MKKHTFLILAHKNVFLLKQLINTLSLYDGNIIVHFDAKTSINLKKEFAEETHLGKAHFIPNNIKVYWAGMSIVHATFLLIDYALSHFPESTYFHLLSENCFPVKSPNYFNAYFEKHNSTNFIKAFALPYSKWKHNGGLNRINHYYFVDYFNSKQKTMQDFLWKSFNAFSRGVQLFINYKRKYPENFPNLYGGSQWWSLTNETIKYLNDYYKNNKAVIRRFTYTLASDEIFIQTIFMNSPFSNLARSDNNLRYVDWRRELPGPYPRILNVKEHWNFIKQPDYLFARKVNPADPSFIEKIKNKIICKSIM